MEINGNGGSMITPSFSLTATERVLPKLALDFTTAVLDPRITLTRALDTATVTNQSGNIVIVNANLPRFDYANGVCKGLLIEESRTNAALNSIFDGAVTGAPGTSPTSWSTAQNTGSITAIAASNYAAGYEIEITCAAQRRTCSQTFSVSANTSYSFSLDVYISSSSSSTIVSDFADIAFGPTGATTSFFVNGVSQASSYSLSVGVQYRITCVMAVSSTAGTAAARWGVGLGATRTTVAKFRNAQFEAGAFATSYIPTTSAALTRNADVATMTGTNFSSWYNTSEGSIVFDYDIPVNRSFGAVGGIGQGTFNTSMRFNVVNAARGTGSSFPNLVTCGTAVLGANKMAIAMKVNDYRSFVNGVSNGTDTNATMLPVATNEFKIGKDDDTDNVYANGWIRKIFYYPQRLTDAELAAFSK